MNSNRKEIGEDVGEHLAYPGAPESRAVSSPCNSGCPSVGGGFPVVPPTWACGSRSGQWV